jgi:hypothetical protein
MQVQVAAHPGGLPLLDVAVHGGGLDYAGYDRSGQVYVVHVTPTAERLTVSIQVRYSIFLPLVLKK